MSLVFPRIRNGREHEANGYGWKPFPKPVVQAHHGSTTREQHVADGTGKQSGSFGFDHPKTGEYMEYSAEMPEEFAELLESLRKKD